MSKKTLAIFDLDGTIVNEQTQKVLLEIARKNKLLSTFSYIKLAMWFTLYSLGIKLKPLKIMTKAYSFLIGKNTEYLETAITELEKVVTYNAEIVKRIKLHTEKGDRVIISSNSVTPIVKHIAAKFSISDIRGTDLNVENNVFIQPIITSINYGEAKVKKLEELRSEYEDVYVYTDHISDLPLLKLATRGFVINPRAKLKKYAESNNLDMIYS